MSCFSFFLIVFIRNLPVVLYKTVPSGKVAISLVTYLVFLVIVLVIFLCLVKILQGFDAGVYWFVEFPGFFEFLFGLDCNFL